MSTEKKPLLPSLAAILYGDKPKSEPCSPLLETINTCFCSDNHGIIRLPPLSTGIARPRSVDSALRQTVSAVYTAPPAGQVASGAPPMRARSLPDTTQPSSVPATVNVPPSTPVVKKKSSGHSSRRTDMLTPLSAARAIITPSTNDKKRAFAFITHSQETFPTKEPKIDNAPLARRKRRRTSTQELNILQAEFDICSAPDKKKRQELAERCNMSEKAVQIWFQNRRQAMKKQKNAAANKAKAITAATPARPRPSLAATAAVTSSEASTNNEKTPLLCLSANSKAPQKQSQSNSTPTRTSLPNNARRGQALTFHLTSDKKILTPLKISPNNRVNKLINGAVSGSPCRRRAVTVSPSGSKVKMDLTPTKRNPLQELNTNTMVH
ncbi:ZYBA0S05-02850g1_1 [Zygosaccharomyces bailii CLIB 213]|uniref:ZYBA0S05-02850g1_1 n=1 Tax=Zygosaccharomyces bailii (strain CLIB 213 / ATCC 58445 / CBS 680 / BCRC 21525 / NBRC 1098 / NCYC 1416 / NRRL Y-2227) TaxID=1333698 RepID=A0A8J2XAY4_ZYGB2|nr:ZYBA0S05-02850g1_1 [Zygosaccharomyces bailii CLIB 213]